MPVLKVAHWYASRSRRGGERTTMGLLRYMLAPVQPYRASRRGLARRGSARLFEFPITVVPYCRLPFFATFLLSTGFETFRQSYRLLRAERRPLQFQFHLSDFVDYTHPELSDQVPRPGSGVYVPKALGMPLKQRLGTFRRVLDTIAADYEFVTLEQWAHELNGNPAPGN
jgi:hypothetical protein